MNERERWIVYPLLCFALGAGLRDKFLQQVATKELHCERLVATDVICEDVSVIDSDKPDRIVAKLAAQKPPSKPGEPSDQFGLLWLRDSEGRELCGVTNNQLQVRQISCEGVRILDPGNQSRVLAGLGSVTVSDKQGKARPFGVLVLNNEDFGTVTGNPPRGVVRQQPSVAKPPDGDEAPADESSAPAASGKSE